MESSETSAGTVTPKSTGIRYGVIGGVIGVVTFLIGNLSGADMTEGPLRWLGWLVALVIIFLAHKYYKDNGNGFMSYGQSVGISFWTGLISGVIGSIFFYIYVKFVDASFIEMIKDKQIEKMEGQGMSQDQIDNAMKIAGMFLKPEVMLLIGFISGIFTYVVCGLIVGIFTQKKAPEQSF